MLSLKTNQKRYIYIKGFPPEQN